MARPLNVVIFGATGVIGQGVLLEALEHPAIGQVLTVGRRPPPVEHEKLRHLSHSDFSDLNPIAHELEGLDACFWCLGISSVGLDEAAYTRITHDYTLAAAEVLHRNNPDLCFCFVSGAGTDETEQGKSMWARVKGKAENAVKRTFRQAYLFRPAFVRPLKGVRPRSRLYRAVIPLFLPFNPLLRVLGGATSTVEIGKAMIAAATGLSREQILDSKSINRLAAALPEAAPEAQEARS